MSWFGIAILVPLIYSLGNYLDKYILSFKEKEHAGPGTVVIFSWLFSTITIPIIFLIGGNPSVSLQSGLLLIANGFIAMTATAFYLYAIDKDEISVVVPLIQITPVFGFIFGFILLDEVITLTQALSALAILLGSIILTLEITSEGRKISSVKWKSDIFLLGTVSALLFAMSGSVFKFFAQIEGYWNTQFWEYAGVSVFGLLFFAIAKQSRRSFVSIIRRNKRDYIFLNLTAETMMVAGDLITNFATLLAPIVLVYVVSALQPAIVFIIGMILALFAPHLSSEQTTKKDIFQKIIAISLIIIGSIGINIF